MFKGFEGIENGDNIVYMAKIACDFCGVERLDPWWYSNSPISNKRCGWEQPPHFKPTKEEALKVEGSVHICQECTESAIGFISPHSAYEKEPLHLKPLRENRTPVPELLRAKVFARDKNICRYCGGVEDLQIDHIFPAIRGGPNERWNLVTACGKCNRRKKDRTPEEAGMELAEPDN